MKVEASMEELFPRIREPPNQSTMTIKMVPRNSLMGCANAWRMDTRLVASRYSLLHLLNRSIIFFSAVKALMTRRPPSVSSSCAMVSPHFP